jgi:hypothetical protein
MAAWSQGINRNAGMPAAESIDRRSGVPSSLSSAAAVNQRSVRPASRRDETEVVDSWFIGFSFL